MTMINRRRSEQKDQQLPLKLIFTFLLFFILNLAQAQVSEVLCNNGKDDDGDGLIDCLDGDCQFVATIEKGCRCYDGIDNDGDGKIDQADPECATYYGLTFVGDGSSCAIVPPGANTPFVGLGLPVTSQQNTADTQSKVAVGDVDGDGVPDAIITSKWNSEVRVVATTGPQADGTDAGKVKSDYNLSGKKNDFKDIGCGTADRLLFEHEVLIADIDKDGKGEIFTVVSNRAGNPESPPTCFFLYGFKYAAGDLLPIAGYPVFAGTNRPGIFGIADMDGDGKAEVYFRDRIFAAENGRLLASAGGKLMSNTADWDVDVPSAPVAVDIKSAGADGGVMELVTGPRIYKIPNLTNRTPAAPGSLTLWRDMNTLAFDANGDGANDQYFVKLMNDPAEYGIDTHSGASVADIDKDGFIDVVMTGAINSSVGRTAVFYWNVQKNTISTVITPNSTELGILATDTDNFNNYSTGWIWGAGRVNIGDANGDGKLDLTFIAGSQLYCVTTNAAGTGLQTLWTQNQKNVAGSIPLGYRTINDSRSGVLTVTIYDFDNDGNPEMVYRDSQELAVIDGTTGVNKLWSAICQSHTYTEGPVIADVNGDGATDICVTCFTSNAFNINAGIQQQALGQVRLFFSNGNAWIPTRKVWNQPGYQVVNINDNLTLPFPQLDPALVFGTGTCPNGVPGPQTPFNVFLNQVPFLSSDGCPVFPLPDLGFFGDTPDPNCNNDPSLPGCDTDGDGVYTPAVEVIPPICGDLNIRVRFNIQNSGYLPITANVPVSFFSKDPQDPTTTAADRLLQSSLPINNLLVGATYTSNELIIPGPGVVFTLYIVLNDNGSVLPITFGSVTNDCTISNNIYSVVVTPDPFGANTEIIRQNEKCVAADPNVGELKGHIYKGDTIAANEIFDYSDYTFQWYYGTDTSNPVPDNLGGKNLTLSALDAGSYTFVATNVSKGCTTIPFTRTISNVIILPSVTVLNIVPQTTCTPPNGSVEVGVVGGNTGFTFEWFSNAAPLGITTPEATNLATGNYQVVVSRNGCFSTTSAFVGDQAIEPDVDATTTPVVDCSTPLSGTVSAVALVAGVAQNPADFTFNWYFHNSGDGSRGSLLPPANGTGPNRTGLAAGFYEVEAVNNATQCKSAPLVREITTTTVLPTVSFTELAPQTSCDPSSPNGRVLAIGASSTSNNQADFTFEWFLGQNTLPTNAHNSVSNLNGGTGNVAEALLAGGQTYTVRVTTPLNCSVTGEITVSQDINVPVVTLTPTPNGICDPALAGTAFGGAMAATVTFDGAAVTDFTNYSFAWYDGSSVTPTPRAETSSSITGLPDGYYTLVVERIDLGCSSLPVTELVDDIKILPDLTPSTTPSTNCAPGTPNGAATVTVNNAGADTFSFQWFAGDDISDPLVPNGNGGNAVAISAVSGGLNYTVRVTNNSTGCRSTSTTIIPDNQQLPILVLDATPNSICDPALGFNGTAFQQTLTDVNALAGDTYTFAWSRGQDMTNPIPGTTASQSGLEDDFYSATITNNRLGCTSSFATTEVLNQQVLPVITITPTPSTNCAGGTPNGAAAATVDVAGVPTTVGYSFSWFQGAAITDPAVPVADGGLTPNAIRLQGTNNFLVQVRNNASGCTSTQVQTIADNSAVPVLSLQDFDNSVCDPAKGFNGSLQATVTADVNAVPSDAYVFTWSNGNNMSSVIAGEVTSLLDELNGDLFYTATVTNTRLNCTSNPFTLEVDNNLILPVISSTPTPSTNCPGGAANGQISVSVTNAGTDPFIFQWYAGNTATAGNEVATAPNQGNTATVIQLQGGLNYTVSAYNDNTGCETTFTQALADISEVPVLSLQDTDNSVCDPAKGFNGSLQGTVTADANVLPADVYVFAWSNGNDMNAIIAGETTSLLDGLDGDLFYTATVRNVRLNCTSNPVTREVKNNLILPDLAGVTNGSTNCAGATPNGSIDVTVQNNPTNQPMIFSWYSDAAATLPLPAPNTGNISTATQLQGGTNVFFTAKVVNDVTGCESTLTMPVADISVLPSITLTVDNNEKCVAPFDGSISIASLTDVNSPAADTYTIRWYNGSVLTPVIGAEDELISNVAEANVTTALTAYDLLDNAFYSVTITNDRLNCTSTSEIREVLDALTFPVITTSVTPSTNCVGGTANGSATVTAPLLAGHDFNWYSGATATGATINTNVDDIDITGLQGSATANFTVEVIIEATGCSSVATVLVADDSELPVVDPLSSTNNENCTAPFSGTATLNGITYRGLAVTFPDAAFTFDFNGTSTNQLTALGVGNYAFTITNIADNCTSDPVSAPVLDDITLPDLQVSEVAQTSCDIGDPNGQLTATIAVVGTAGHTFEWFNGAGAGASGTGFSTSNALSNLPSAEYTVRAINTTTRCESVQSRLLPDNKVNPAISFTGIQDVQSCLPPDGQATPVLTGISALPTNDFTIYYVRTFSTPTDPNVAPVDPTIIKASLETYSSTAALGVGNPPDVLGLAPGFLTAIVVDNNTTCESSPTTIQIEDATQLNQINVGLVTAAGFCGGIGGSIDVTVTGGTGAYTFEWYPGSPINNNINFFNNPPNMGAAALITNNEDLGVTAPVGGVGSGTYTLIVRDAVGCGAYQIGNVPFASAPTINIATIDPTRCNAPFDGEIEVTVTAPVVPGTDPYSIAIYRGNSATGSILQGNEICGDGIDNDGDGFIDEVVDCESALISPKVITLAGLEAGEYFVRVIDYTPANRPCPLDNGVVLTQEGFAPIVTVDNINPNTACDDTNFADGSVEITVSQDADDLRNAAATPLIFEVTQVTPAPVTPPAFPAVLSNGLSTVTTTLNYGFAPQAYTLRVTETASGCFTDQVVNIPDQPVVPQIIDVTTNPETFCLPFSNGNATVNSVTPVDIEDYQYTWYSNAALSVQLYQDNGAVGAVFDASKPGYATGTTGSGYGNQTVYVRGERLPGTGAGVGCPTPAVSRVILDEHIAPVAVLTPLPTTSCDPAVGEGSISVTASTASANAAVNTAQYTYDITPDPNAAGPDNNNAGTTPFLFTSLTQNGGVAYTVTTTNEVSGCLVNNNVTILSNPYTLAITAFTKNDQLICNPDGDIDVTEIVINRPVASGGAITFTTAADLNNSFEFRWHRADAATPNVFNPAIRLQDPGAVNIEDKLLTGNLAPAAGEYNAIGAGAYYVIAERINGGVAPVIGFGCETPPLRVDILDQHVNPVVNLIPFSNTACVGGFEGELDVEVTDASVVAGPFTFNYTWTAVTSTTTPGPLTSPYAILPGVDANFTGLEEGSYSIEVSNIQTGCEAVDNAIIVKNTTPIFVTDFTVTPKFYCEPSGNAEITEVTFEDRDGVENAAPLVDFTYAWSFGGGGIAPVGVRVDSTNHPTISAGFYSVIATRTANSPGLGCASAPIIIEIKDETENPIITLTPFSNTACIGGFEGQLEVDISDASVPKTVGDPDFGVAFNYNYTWAAGTPAPAGALPPNDINQTGLTDLYQNLGEGQYNISVVNNITGCTATATTTIVKNATPIFVTTTAAIPQFYCDPSGSAEVTGITFEDRDGNILPAPIADFDFAWTQGGAAVGGTIAVLDSTNYAAIGAGVYSVIATRNLTSGPGRGCSSAPILIEIRDETENPVITLTPFSNTSCTNAFEGEIEIDIVDASVPKAAGDPDFGVAFNYNYTWSAGTPAPVGVLPPNDVAQNGLNNLYQNLGEGQYVLTAVNQVTNCQAVGSTQIIKNTTPVFVQDVNMIPQMYCPPIGSGNLNVVAVTFNDRNGVTQNGPLGDFEYIWSRNTIANVVATTNPALPQLPGYVGTELDSTVLADIGAGSYFVVARRALGAPGAGCSSAPFRVEIIENTENPAVTFTTLANTACDNNFDGRITVLSSNQQAPGAGANYDLTWVSIPALNTLTDVTNVGVSYTTPLTDVIGPGQFRVRVTNRETQCFTEAIVAMVSNPQPVEIVSIDKEDQDICFADGSISVLTMNNGVLVDYTYNWFRNSPTTTPLQDGTNTTIVSSVLDVTNFAQMGAGTYYVVGIKNPGSSSGSGCETPPYEVVINDLSVDPDVDFTFTPNSSCIGGTPNGEIIALAVERDGSTDNYTFAWDFNSGALHPATTQTDLTPQSTLSLAPDGLYSLEVANTITGCTFDKNLNLTLDQQLSLPNIVEVIPVNPLNCFPTGSAAVTQITIGGVRTVNSQPELDADFDYIWYKNDFPANEIVGQTLATLPNQLPDTYFVLVRDLFTNCESAPVEVVIDDTDIVYPVVAIRQSLPQISCDASFGTAELIATVDNGQTSTNVNYVFEWFQSLDGTPPVFAAAPASSTISDLMAGDYSVTVLNQATNCASTALFIVPNAAPQFLPQLALSTFNRTRCDINDGSLSASGIPFPIDPTQPLNNYPFPYNYEAEIITPALGLMANDPNFPAFTSNFVRQGLDIGNYTVSLTDLNTGCVTIESVDLEDGRVLPTVAIVEDNPLINCDPARANGQLSATADGGLVGGYDFEWFAGTTASGTTLSNSNLLIGQTAGNYTVLVTNLITACQQDEVGEITDGTVDPPAPDASLVRGRTSCVVPNGIVTVDVDGETLGYIFNWYDGNTTTPTSDFVGIDYFDRDIGDYAVTATDIITGCVSLPSVIAVPDLRVLPQVELTSTPSYCLTATGSVNLELLNPDDVLLTDITWFDLATGGQIGSGPATYELFAGFYRAEFISFEGCEGEAEVEVGTEILSYNLVSANSDNSNDFWNIDCIQNFPNNNVKVFNRSGVKVFEANGYNNSDVIFRGIGENGLYTLGNDLPDGTYFYIIDKRDGSKPVTGYLELVH